MEKIKYRSFTNILFNNPSFIRGVARNFDIFRLINKYNTSRDELEADSKAAYSDWSTVGNDIRNSLSVNHDRKK